MYLDGFLCLTWGGYQSPIAWAAVLSRWALPRRVRAAAAGAWVGSRVWEDGFGNWKRGRLRHTTCRAKRLCGHTSNSVISAVSGVTDKTVGYQTLQSAEGLISLGKATAHVVYPAVLAVRASNCNGWARLWGSGQGCERGRGRRCKRNGDWSQQIRLRVAVRGVLRLWPRLARRRIGRSMLIA